MRVELQEQRGELYRLSTEKKELEDRLVVINKEHERQLRKEKDSYNKLKREFARQQDKNRELQRIAPLNNSVARTSSSNSIGRRHPHSRATEDDSGNGSMGGGQTEVDGGQQVIFF